MGFYGYEKRILIELIMKEEKDNHLFWLAKYVW